VSDDGRHRDDEWAITIALFRYQVIATLVEQELEEETVSAEVARIVRDRHYLPGKGRIRVGKRTVYRWLKQYRSGGIEALRPRWRKDKGSRRKLSTEALERAIRLREENPKRSTTTLIDILVREGTLKGSIPHRATFDRHLDRRGASRRRMKVLGSRPTKKMVFASFGDLWVGDYHDGPVILGPDGNPTTTKLGAFIDHHTRYPVADRYYLSENLATLRDTLKRGFLKWGVPTGKVYVDRGSVYRSRQLAYAIDRIGAKLVHSKAYYSQGRGVIEVWWRIALAFESEVALLEDLITLHELNRLWEAFRELRYIEAVHSELGISPKEAIADVKPKPIAPDVVRKLFLVKDTRRVNKKNACVSVEGTHFQCESWLRQRKVEVRFDPSDLSSVLIYLDGEKVQTAFPQVPNNTPEPAPEPVERPKPSVDYLSLLRADYDRQLLEHARPLAYARLATDPCFDRVAFMGTVTDLAGLDGRPSTTRELRDFWATFGPLPESLVRIAVEHAVRLHTRSRHPRVYLDAIRTLVIAHLRGRPAQDDKERP
jgi:transposase InsO family protein